MWKQLPSLPLLLFLFLSSLVPLLLCCCRDQSSRSLFERPFTLFLLLSTSYHTSNLYRYSPHTPFIQRSLLGVLFIAVVGSLLTKSISLLVAKNTRGKKKTLICMLGVIRRLVSVAPFTISRELSSCWSYQEYGRTDY